MLKIIIGKFILFCALPSAYLAAAFVPNYKVASYNINSSNAFVLGEGGGIPISNSEEGEEDVYDVSLETFQQARKKRESENEAKDNQGQEIDGYFLRDVILEKWGYCFDVDFNRVDSFGFRELYLNVLPFHLGGRRFRHETELDYLCHLQAVVEILQKYDQMDNILVQIADTKKKPRAGTVPIMAVPLRLDLTREQVQDILGY